MITSPLRVLLVEDSPPLLEILSCGVQRALEEQWPGRTIELHTALDGREAQQLLAQGAFALLITDLYVPIIDGKQLITNLRADPAHRSLKILAISASSTTAHEDALRAGADLFLHKPLRLRELALAIKNLLGGA